MGKLTALKLAALVGFKLSTYWFAPLGVKFVLGMPRVAARWRPGHALVLRQHVPEKQLHHKAAVCPIWEPSFSLCPPVLTVVFEYRFALEALPHVGYLDKVASILQEERLRPWQPFPTGCAEMPPYTASGWCCPALGLISLGFSSISPTLIDAPSLRSAGMVVTKSLLSHSLDKLLLLQLIWSNVRHLALSMLMLESLTGWFTEIKLSRDAASRSCCWSMASKVEAGATADDVAADDMVSLFVSFTVAALMPWGSTASGPILGTFERDFTAVCSSSVCPSVRDLEKCFCIMAVFNSPLPWTKSKPVSLSAVTVVSDWSFCIVRSWEVWALSIVA